MICFHARDKPISSQREILNYLLRTGGFTRRRWIGNRCPWHAREQLHASRGEPHGGRRRMPNSRARFRCSNL